MPHKPAASPFETYRDGGTTLDISMMVKLVLAVRGFRGQLDEQLRKVGQSTSRMETLAAIMNMQGPKSQTDVAKRLRVEGATVTRMVDLLSKEGLVERKPHPNDRRVNLISITPRGVEVMERIFEVYDAARNSFLAEISREDMASMHSILDRMLHRLDNPDGPAAVRIDDMQQMDRLRDTPAKD